MPSQEQLYVTPKIGYVDAMPLFRSRHLALNSPLGHFNGDNAHLSTRRTKLTVTPKLISSNGNMVFAKLRRTQSLARPTTRAIFSTLSYLYFVSLLTTRLAAQKQTKYSMLQIKTIPKNTFQLRHLEPSPLFTFIYQTTISKIPYKLSEETTQRKHTHTHTHTHVYTIFLAKNKTFPC